MSTISVPTREQGKQGKQGRKPFILAAAGAALVLVAALAVGTWGIIEHQGGTDTAATTAPQGEAAGAAPPAVTAGADQRFTVYIVGSEEEAARLWQTFEFVSDPSRASSPSPANTQVVVANSTEDMDRTQRQLDELDNMRAGLGLPGLTRIDLRTRPSASTAGPAGDGRSPESDIPHLTP